MKAGKIEIERREEIEDKKNEREASRKEVKRKPSKEGNKRTVSQLTTTAKDHICNFKNVTVCF